MPAGASSRRPRLSAVDEQGVLLLLFGHQRLLVVHVASASRGSSGELRIFAVVAGSDIHALEGVGRGSVRPVDRSCN